MMSLMNSVRHWTQRWRPQADAGVLLRQMEDAGQVIVWGEDPQTCEVELVCPALGQYACPPRIPVDAWLAAWRISRFPAAERDQAIRQDYILFRASLAALAWLAVDGFPEVVLNHVRFHELVAVAHQWWLLYEMGVDKGQRHFVALQAQVPSSAIDLEARLIYQGICLTYGVQPKGIASGGDEWEVDA